MKHNFRELRIWKASIRLTKEIYKLTNQFPKEEMFGLTNQLRRWAVSVASNIAEGCGRDSDKQLVNYLNFSMGSICEMETQIILARELNYINKEISDQMLVKIDDLEKMIFSFKRTIKNNIS